MRFFRSQFPYKPIFDLRTFSFALSCALKRFGRNLLAMKYFALERVLSLVDIEWHFVTVLRSVLRGAH